MAILTIYRELGTVAYVPGEIVLASATHLRIVAGQYTYDIRGTDLWNDGANDNGLITGFEYSDATRGGLQFSVTGLQTYAFALFDHGVAAIAQGFFYGDDLMIGSDGRDFLEGSIGRDLLQGGPGADTLAGGADHELDTLVGGTGNDTYLLGVEPFWTRQDDEVFEAPGEGWDAIVAWGDFALPAHFEELWVVQGQQVTGNELDNLLSGNDSDNLMDGRAGADTLEGGLGDDTYLIDPADTVVDEGGTDTVAVAFDGYVLAPEAEYLVLSGAALTAWGNARANWMVGSESANRLFGLAGNDELDGGLGADTMDGGIGDDTYHIDNPLDVLVELAGGGIDLVLSPFSLTLVDDLENLRLTGPGGLRGVGNSLPNVITGGTGDDTLDGGAGADTLNGGEGADVFLIDHPGDWVQDRGGAEFDTAISTVSYVIPQGSGIDILILTGTLDLQATGEDIGTALLQGNAGHNMLHGAQELQGGAGNDSLSGGWKLDGGEGVDTLVGGAMWNTFIVDDAGDVVTEPATSPGQEASFDEIFSAVSYSLPLHVESLVLTGGAAVDATGTAAGGESLTGNDAANVLDGAGGSGDDLAGAGGNDTLMGYAGGRLQGGTGDDTYHLQDLATVVVEPSDGGTDTVFAPGDYSLAAHFDRLVLVAGLSGKGNDLANHITGNASANLLDGGAGADTLQGGLGDDQYRVDDAGDVVVELDGQGVDSVTAEGVGYSLAHTSVEHLLLRGGAALRTDATGNGADNRIEGSTGANSITGAEGADTLLGGRGDDTLDGGAGNDLLEGQGGADEARYAGLRASHTVTRGTGAVTVTGAQGVDVLVGVDRIVFADGQTVLNAHEPTGSMAISGFAMVDRMLTAIDQTGDGDGKGAVSWQWFRGETAIEGATGATRVPTTADLFAQLRVRAQYVDGAGNTETVWSDPSSMVLYNDTSAPTLSVQGGASGPTAAALVYGLYFSEVVYGLTVSDFVVGNGSIASLVPQAGKPWAWDLTVIPPEGFAGTLTVGLQAGAVADALGNENAFAAVASQVVDTLGPIFVGVSMDPLVGGRGGPIALLFSKPVVAGGGTVTLSSVGNPALTQTVPAAAAQVVDGQLWLDPAFDFEPTTPYRLSLSADAVRDAAGHPLAGEAGFVFFSPVMRFATAQGQLLEGSAFSELMLGGAGDDTLAGGAGDDLLNGGGGRDTALYGGARRDFSVQATALGHAVIQDAQGAEGSDLLAQVERLQFSDYSVELTLPARALQLAPAALKTLEELYVGFFNRIPEAQGLGYWIDQLASGMSLSTIADRFHDAGLDFGVYPPGLDNAAFIRIIYANVLGRPSGSPTAPNNDEVAHWDAWLQQAGHSRGTMVLQMLSDVHTWFTGHAQFGFVARHLDNKAALAHYYAVEQGLGLVDAQANISFGTELAALVTPDDLSAAVTLIGVG